MRFVSSIIAWNVTKMKLKALKDCLKDRYFVFYQFVGEMFVHWALSEV